MQWDDIPPVVNYLRVRAPGHPLADLRGHVSLHRWLLYRQIGPGPHPCHWCGASVAWMARLPLGPLVVGALVVDHVDGNRGNNEDDNLVPSCARCNLRRGAPTERVPATARPPVPLCRCGCGVPAHADTGLARGRRSCSGHLHQKFWARVEKSDEPNGCWLWVGIKKATGPTGYGRLFVDGALKRAHRVSWELHHGAIPEGMDVCHVCDTPACVRPDHLHLGTHAENMAEKQARNRASRRGAGPGQVRGERSASAKLTESDVHEIRRLLADGHTLRAVAARFGVSKGPITGIARGVLWKHVPLAPV